MQLINCFEKKSKTRWINIPEDYLCCDALISERENVKIEDETVTILNPEKFIRRRIKPTPHGARATIPKSFVGKDLIILIDADC